MQWIAELRQTPHCNQYFKELLDLIQHKLFCLEPKTRERCDTLVLQLRDLPVATYDYEATALLDDCPNIVSEIRDGEPPEGEGLTPSTSYTLHDVRNTWHSYSDRGSYQSEGLDNPQDYANSCNASLATCGETGLERYVFVGQGTERESTWTKLLSSTEETPLLGSSEYLNTSSLQKDASWWAFGGIVGILKQCFHGIDS